jgi:hypothetical protein
MFKFRDLKEAPNPLPKLFAILTGKHKRPIPWAKILFMPSLSEIPVLILQE